MNERYERCDRCRFYEKRTHYPNFGYCKRKAPYPFQTDVLEGPTSDPRTRYAHFTTMRESDWCGEFEPVNVYRTILEVLSEAESNGDKVAAQAMKDLLKEKVGL